jgi:hypothetical protein
MPPTLLSQEQRINLMDRPPGSDDVCQMWRYWRRIIQSRVGLAGHRSQDLALLDVSRSAPRCPARPSYEVIATAQEHAREIGATERCRRVGNRLQRSVEILRRTADHPQHTGRRLLALKCLVALAGSIAPRSALGNQFPLQHRLAVNRFVCRSLLLVRRPTGHVTLLFWAEIIANIAAPAAGCIGRSADAGIGQLTDATPL